MRGNMFKKMIQKADSVSETASVSFTADEYSNTMA